MNLNCPEIAAKLLCFQDAFADQAAALMLAADLFVHAKAAAEIRRNDMGQVIELLPIDITTLYITSDCAGNMMYQQLLPDGTEARTFFPYEILYLTRNKFL